VIGGVCVEKVYTEKRVLAIISLLVSLMGFVAFSLALMIGIILVITGKGLMNANSLTESGLGVFLLMLCILFFMALVLLFVILIAIGVIGGVLPFIFDILALRHNDLKAIGRLRTSNIIKSVLYLICSIKLSSLLVQNDFNTGAVLTVLTIVLMLVISLFIAYRANFLYNKVKESEAHG